MESLHDQLTSRKGTYALALQLNQAQQIIVGALGKHHFPAGRYIYTGSAWGPGGLRARLARHIRGSANLHWHIDYLRHHAQPVGYWVASEQRVECMWANYLAQHPQAHIVIPGFGSSDCHCITHLFQWDELMFSELTLPESFRFTAL